MCKNFLLPLLIMLLAMSATGGCPQNTFASRSLTFKDGSQLVSFVQRNPQHAEGHYLLGRLYGRSGYLNLAEQEYKRAWDLDPSFVEPALLLLQLQLKMKEKSASRELAHRALARFAGNFKALVELAVLMHVYYQFSEAERFYLAAKKIRPQAPEIASALGYTFLAQKKYKAALAEAEQALVAPKMRHVAYALKGQALLGLNFPEQAIPCFKAAFVIEPADVEVSSVYFKTVLKQGRVEEALLPGLYILAMTAQDAHLCFPVKTALMRVLRAMPYKQAHAAIEEVTRSLRSKQMTANYHFALGDIYDRMDQPEKAMAQYNAGLALDSKHARAYMRLGKDLEHWCHDYAAAYANYKKAYELKSDDPEITTCYKRLSSRLTSQKYDIALLLKNSVAQVMQIFSSKAWQH